MDVERRIMKPNKNFELTIRDIEVIESALRAKAGRRGMAIAEGNVSEKLKEEMHEIQELLGRIHHQKVWYSPKEFVPGG
jgi:streptomycin 6-kinase|tara:strand:- start:45 stop:281 length:237 start_codon:yes stop_codon:yes gene_type:complete